MTTFVRFINDNEVCVKALAFPSRKFTGNEYDLSTEEIGPHGGNTNAKGSWIEETGCSVLIFCFMQSCKKAGIQIFAGLQSYFAITIPV